MSPYTFLRAIGPGTVECCLRVAITSSSRWTLRGKPNCLYQHQYSQVVMKPSPSNIQELCTLSRLEKLGINWNTISVSLNNWENPSTGSAGLGWEVCWTVRKSPVHLLPTSWWFGNWSAVTSGGHLRLGTFGFLHPRSRFCLWYWVAPGVKYGEIFLLNQNMNIKNTALKFLTKICFWKLLKNLKKKQTCLNWALFTQSLWLRFEMFAYLSTCLTLWCCIRYRTCRLHCLQSCTSGSVSKPSSQNARNSGYPLLSTKPRAKLLAEEEE